MMILTIKTESPVLGGGGRLPSRPSRTGDFAFQNPTPPGARRVGGSTEAFLDPAALPWSAGAGERNFPLGPGTVAVRRGCNIGAIPRGIFNSRGCRPHLNHGHRPGGECGSTGIPFARNRSLWRAALSDSSGSYCYCPPAHLSAGIDL